MITGFSVMETAVCSCRSSGTDLDNTKEEGY